jgi:integrase
MLFGFLAREGCRASEAVAIEWSDLDLKRGSISLDINKTDDPRAWALDAGVTRALRWWKGAGAPKAGPFAGMSTSHLADRLRESLRTAGVTREALFENTERRSHIQAHHLRGTFVTLNLAAGKTETWVQDRTGHRDTAMVNKYRRSARTAAELGIGNLTPLDRAIPEVGARMGHGKRNIQDKKGAKKS